MFKGFKFANPAKFLSKSEGALVWVMASASTLFFVSGIVRACLGFPISSMLLFVFSQVFLVTAIPFLLKAQAYITRNGITGPKGTKASGYDANEDSDEE